MVKILLTVILIQSFSNSIQSQICFPNYFPEIRANNTFNSSIDVSYCCYADAEVGEILEEFLEEQITLPIPVNYYDYINMQNYRYEFGQAVLENEEEPSSKQFRYTIKKCEGTKIINAEAEEIILEPKLHKYVTILDRDKKLKKIISVEKETGDSFTIVNLTWLPTRLEVDFYEKDLTKIYYKKIFYFNSLKQITKEDFYAREGIGISMILLRRVTYTYLDNKLQQQLEEVIYLKNNKLIKNNLQVFKYNESKKNLLPLSNENYKNFFAKDSSEEKLVFGLHGRKIINQFKSDIQINESGKVAVDITVDSSGNVVKALIDIKRTTTSNSVMRKEAINRAVKLKFNSSETPEQTGKIIFDFKSKN